MLSSCNSTTYRTELLRIFKELCLKRIANELGLNKIMLPDDSDDLGRLALSQLCLGRGGAVSNLTGVLDKRKNVVFVRPIREISKAEIGIFNHLSGFDNDCVHLEHEKIFKNSVQSLTDGFVGTLFNEGFKSTITTVLSTTGKIHGAEEGNTTDRCSQISKKRKSQEFLMTAPRTNIGRKARNVFDRLDLMGLRNFVLKLISGREHSPEGDWVEGLQVDHFEPYTAGQVTKHFTATVADEITVPRGTTIKALYREEQWIYVQASDGRRGFVPQSHCKLRVQQGPRPRRDVATIQRKRIKEASNNSTLRRPLSQNNIEKVEKRWEKSNLERFLDSLPVKKEEGELFVTKPEAKTIVIYSFNGQKTDDLSVEAGESVTVLNTTDPDWTYVSNIHNDQGFVPSTFLECASDEQRHGKGQNRKAEEEDVDLLVVEDHPGRSAVDLTVAPGEWIRELSPQVDGWMWAKRCGDGKEGFVPAKFAILATDL
ncbi:unnamed protein product [Caenorhabditis auriculariae]|uniref:SH3 domain-containing protein n=1 Tax=Caenorhabditis auriculariae TaxID=2777116 RepID=A0A8S1GTH5_9PELO|nr:unnamed protein product [Caenorhabditis auriculariae]